MCATVDIDIGEIFLYLHELLLWAEQVRSYGKCYKGANSSDF